MRSILTRFRISAHKFEIETRRCTTPKTHLENRLCKQCNLSEIEDEEHFLINCPKYSLPWDWKELFRKLNNSNFSELINMNKFAWLLSNEDIYVNVEIAKYLSNCFILRDTKQC